MPELPEVETVRNYLQEYLVEQSLEEVVEKKPNVWKAFPDASVTEKIIGQTCTSVQRVGKYIILEFTHDYLIIVHFRMTGKLLYLPLLEQEEATKYLNDKHSHVLLYFDKSILLYHDVRRFGGLVPLHKSDLPDLPGSFNKLGPDAYNEPLSVKAFAEYAQRYPKKQIKAALLDQLFIAGLGNIYVDEILFKSAIRPERNLASLSEDELGLILVNMREILTKAIQEGGTTFSDYRNLLDQGGNYQNFLQVYGRGGKPCYTCGAELQKVKVAGRNSVYCVNCQF